ncbi:MAG: DNA/RNA non-specific endonuclease [Carboxylicivirga sp.]|jgi:endonuclease G|nr:DNA/RNA non-specific endonuclease [Carboxylicivirga sp.]
MKHLISTTLLFISSLTIWAQYQPSSHGEVIQHAYYSLSYVEDHEQAEWVYYHLTPSLVEGSQARTDNFRPDPAVSSGSATLADYQNSGYDRGHLCPAGDMKLNQAAMSETFFMSNMSPQTPSFNRGIWKKLEATVRQWAIAEGSIHVVTAGILTSPLQHISASDVSIPQSYYKVIYAPASQKMIAFILPNKKSSIPLQHFAVSVDRVEQLTGIDFFPQLDNQLEERLEAKTDAAQWTFSLYQADKRASKNNNSGTAKQCLGIAKSTGKRCRNNTTNANGYCKAHQTQAQVKL